MTLPELLQSINWDYALALAIALGWIADRSSGRWVHISIVDRMLTNQEKLLDAVESVERGRSR